MSFPNKISPNVKFESILDSDNVELFNRDTLYYSRLSLVNFIEQKRMLFKKDRRLFTIIILSLMAIFSTLSITFLVATIISIKDNYSPNEEVTAFDNEQYKAQLKFFENCNAVAPQDRIDCNPDPPISREQCEKRGCCWNPFASNKMRNFTLFREKALPPLDVPYCYFGANYAGYLIVKNTTDKIYLKRFRPSGFFGDINKVRVDVQELSHEIVRIKFTDLENERFEVPIPKLNFPSKTFAPKLYSVTIEDNNLIVRRVETEQNIFCVNLAVLVYSNQLIQITSLLPSNFIYGLGEHREPFRKPTNWKRYTMMNRDQYPLPNMPLYGSHPFYLTVEEQSSLKGASGVFLFNSNPMDIITQPSPAITFRTIGGILDFFIFLGPRPEDVISQYHRLIGTPVMPPFWSLGYHLSRFGYRNLTNLNETFFRNIEQDIPIDAQWTDIDALHSNNDFTYDEQHFNGLPSFVNFLHKNGIRYVPIFDCGISSGEAPDSYLPFDLGVQMDVFMKNSSGNIFFGKVWNKKSTVWPDFFHPNATNYWTRMLAKFHQTIPFDGAWIDMNEPSNFLDGQISGCPQNKLETPSYTPGMNNDNLTLRHKTICMTAQHYNGQLHYNLHNLYGFKEAIVTNEALKKILNNKRPFILSRSTAPGHGHWAYHWTGDIISDWSSMNWSIASILEFNMFGIPMVGADICGFNGNTTLELCARWHQLGAFYTFARNHNTDDAIDQDPAALGIRVVHAARNALLVRYAHLSYLYTLFYRAQKFGGTVLRPLFFEFTHDNHCYKIDSQFMWGSAMMIAPVLSPQQKNINVYFPKGRWFFVGDFQELNSNGEFISRPASMIYPNVYYRSGYIIPIQKPQKTAEYTSRENFTLMIILENEYNNAIGELYLDSGDGLNTEHLGLYNYYHFKVDKEILYIESKHLGYKTTQVIEEIIILGFYQKPKFVFINGNEGQFVYNYDESKHKLTINAAFYLPLFNSSSTVISHRIQWILK